MLLGFWSFYELARIDRAFSTMILWYFLRSDKTESRAYFGGGKIVTFGYPYLGNLVRNNIIGHLQQQFPSLYMQDPINWKIISSAVYVFEVVSYPLMVISYYHNLCFSYGEVMIMFLLLWWRDHLIHRLKYITLFCILHTYWERLFPILKWNYLNTLLYI